MQEDKKDKKLKHKQTNRQKQKNKKTKRPVCSWASVQFEGSFEELAKYGEVLSP